MPKYLSIGSFGKDVTTSASRIQTSSTGRRFVQNAIILANDSNSAIVYVGGDDVSSTTGIPLQAGEALNLGDVFMATARTELDLYNIWAVSASGTQNLRIVHDKYVQDDS